jgi:hypothetical protein
MKKLSRHLIFILIFAIPLFSYAQRKVQTLMYGQHEMTHGI